MHFAQSLLDPLLKYSSSQFSHIYTEPLEGDSSPEEDVLSSVVVTDVVCVFSDHGHVVAAPRSSRATGKYPCVARP